MKQNMDNNEKSIKRNNFVNGRCIHKREQQSFHYVRPYII